jgi:predicted alternative tryptophan synthase beta-subunit
MRKDVAGAVANQTGAGRWPIGLSSAAQLFGEVAVGMVAGAPGVLAYRSVVVAAAQQVESTLRHLSER